MRGPGGGGVRNPFPPRFDNVERAGENETMVARRKMAVVIMALFSLRMRVIGNKSSDK